MRGFQLWINLPARLKMSEPRYQEYGPERIPEVTVSPGVRVKVIAGTVADITGPIEQAATSPTYLDIRLDPGTLLTQPLPEQHNAFIYVYEGALSVGGGSEAAPVSAQQLAVLGYGERLSLEASSAGARAILVAGRPLREPVARYGPFVMNTREEIIQAVEDFRAGRF